MAIRIEPSVLLTSLSKNGLLPSSVIPETFQPAVQLNVSFDDKPVAAGNLFRASWCKNAPNVSFTPEVQSNPHILSFSYARGQLWISYSSSTIDRLSKLDTWLTTPSLKPIQIRLIPFC